MLSKPARKALLEASLANLKYANLKYVLLVTTCMGTAYQGAISLKSVTGTQKQVSKHISPKTDCCLTGMLEAGTLMCCMIT